MCTYTLIELDCPLWLRGICARLSACPEDQRGWELLSTQQNHHPAQETGDLSNVV